MARMPEARIAFVGGSGLYEMEGLTNTEDVNIKTPFGEPSDKIVIGTMNGERVAFLPRHSRGHRYSPTEIPVRANIYALKSLGVEKLISISAVGSLKEEVRPLDLLIPDQFIDRTRNRANTFFEDGIVAHVGFADPICQELSSALFGASTAEGASVHNGGTYVVMEGPQFSTRAESELYRSWGASVIGMTALPEAKLAREAEMCYATMALVTDYDCWHQSEESVSVELVIANLLKNVATSQRVISRLVPMLSTPRNCGCKSALKDAIITHHDYIGVNAKQRLSIFVDKYLE